MTDDPKALISDAREWEGMEWPAPEDKETLKFAHDAADRLIRRLADALEREMARPINVTLASDNDVVRLPGITLGPVTRS